eukprot:TRINITY_DN17067_c0_g1_i1.p1 TRINITY_DN17067_c0_g1~~TRINITY_DN17067_c0_g1_i1.p1  ORF type:complete len:189 (-),score=12.79 TRINITY_DN17067_c0_g1_i1:59-625(-)
MLALTVTCGALRYHLPNIGYLASHPQLGRVLKLATLLLPMSVCSAAAVYNSVVCVGEECFSEPYAVAYAAMAAFTGCFAGLVGIGGGLIFSPFFLAMGVDPSVAVATSSTCVLFTSSSTTLQYLLTGRIIMSLTVLYGVVNWFASYCGTSLVLFLQERFAGRRSYISGIVAVAVLISTGLVAAKLFNF